MIRLLLVDDHPTLRHGLRALISTQPEFEVVAEAADLAGAIAAASDATSPADVALVDLDLGAGNPTGIDVVRALSKAAPKLKAIVFSAYDSDADVVNALDAGAAGYLVKDSTPEQLFHAIRAAVAGESALAAPIASRLHDRARFAEEALTSRELEVLGLAATGLSNRDLAASLMVSEATVKTHLHHAFTKLGAENRQAAIALAVSRGLIRM